MREDEKAVHELLNRPHDFLVNQLDERDRWRYRLTRYVTWPLETFFRGLPLFAGSVAVFRISGFGWVGSIGWALPVWVVIHLAVTWFCNLFWIWGFWSRLPDE